MPVPARRAGRLGQQSAALVVAQGRGVDAGPPRGLSRSHVSTINPYPGAGINQDGQARVAQAFLDGAGPAAIGAILGSAILLAGTLREPWQFAVLAGAAVLLLGPALPVVRRGVVLTLLAAAATGLLVALAGGPLPQ